MPGYVVVQDPRGAPCNGAAVWANGYLPAVHQGTLLRDHGSPILNPAITNPIRFEDLASDESRIFKAWNYFRDY